MGFFLLIAAGLLLFQQRESQGSSSGGSMTTGKNPGIREELRSVGERMQTKLGWDNYANFLDAVAYTESRWRQFAGGLHPGSNKAQGPYQMRPDSAGDYKEMRELFRAHPILLTEPHIATACATAYFWRTGASPVKKGLTWERLRSSFAYPFFINGRDAVYEYSAERGTLGSEKGITPKRYDASIKRFRQAIKAAKVPLNPEGPALPPQAPKSGTWELATPSGKGTVSDLLFILGVPSDLPTLQSIALEMEAARG